MPIQARRMLRRMRGGAQAHLMEGDDDRFYIVKFIENPQHRRILVNEWIAGALLRYLEVAQPEVRVIELSASFLEQNPDVCIQLGASRKTISPGWHFGSCFPGNPDRVAVYDFVPDTLLKKTVNLSHFFGALVFDKWLANSDSRQSIFFRGRVADWSLEPGHPRQTGLIAQMIDHGYIFDGPHWNFNDSPIAGLYMRKEIYSAVRSLDAFEPWLGRVLNFPESVIDEALRGIPPAWLEGEDAGALESVLEKLLRRRKRVPDLIADCRNGRVNPFPNWA